MKIIASLDNHQSHVIEKILRHCGLWQDPPPRAPPVTGGTSHPANASADPDSGPTFEVDPEFLEHVRPEQVGPPQLSWEAWYGPKPGVIPLHSALDRVRQRREFWTHRD
jgi:hypothetical protein